MSNSLREEEKHTQGDERKGVCVGVAMEKKMVNGAPIPAAQFQVSQEQRLSIAAAADDRESKRRLNYLKTKLSLAAECGEIDVVEVAWINEQSALQKDPCAFIEATLISAKSGIAVVPEEWRGTEEANAKLRRDRLAKQRSVLAVACASHPSRDGARSDGG